MFRKTAAPCPVCGTPIERDVVAGRGTHYCPQCQQAAGSRQQAERRIARMADNNK